MVDYIQQSGTMALWALQEPGTQTLAPKTTVQVLKHLAGQALVIRAASISENISCDFNATRIASASTAEHWAEVLKHALLGVPLVYIAVDLSLLIPTNEFRNEAASLFSITTHLINICRFTRLKVVVVSKQRVPRKDYVKSCAEILEIDKTMPSSSGPSPGPSRQPMRRGTRRGRGRGAVTFYSGPR